MELSTCLCWPVVLHASDGRAVEPCSTSGRDSTFLADHPLGSVVDLACSGAIAAHGLLCSSASVPVIFGDGRADEPCLTSGGWTRCWGRWLRRRQQQQQGRSCSGGCRILHLLALFAA